MDRRTGWVAIWTLAILLASPWEPRAADSPNPRQTPPLLPPPPLPRKEEGAIEMPPRSGAGPAVAAPMTPEMLKPADSPLEGPDLRDVPTWSELARAILLTAIPDKYEDRKHWDKTRQVFDGVRVQQRGFNIRLSERKRTVNDGSWYKFTVRFPEPEKNASVLIDHVEASGIGKFSFAIHVAMKQIRIHGQFEQWILGVKGLNFDVESDVEVHLHAVCMMEVRSERQPTSLLPDLILDPSIRSIRLNLVDVNTRRIGRVGGDIAEELGNGSRKFFEDLIHAQEGRVLKKANEAIQKKKDSLRIPASKLW